MKVLSFILMLYSIMFVGCEWKMWRNMNNDYCDCIKVQRYDRLESRYLTTGDYSALQQMNTDYPTETRTLIEKVLQLGTIEDSEIHHRFLHYYQDTTLQRLITDVEAEFNNISDVNEQFCRAFSRLSKWFPNLPQPKIYTQISSLDQSIIVGNGTIGVSLDKYMGEDYSLYKRFYTPEQTKTMHRGYIVPDALSFYLLAQYSLDGYDTRSQIDRDLHMAKIWWVVNKATAKQSYQNWFVDCVDRYMHAHPNVTYEELISSDNYKAMMP